MTKHVMSMLSGAVSIASNPAKALTYSQHKSRSDQVGC